MKKQVVLQFDIEGEYLTSLAREWFYVEGKGYDKCIELLNCCMSGTDETKEQIRRHVEDLLLGRAALKGSTREGSYHLELYGAGSEEKMPENMNIWSLFDKMKNLEKELQKYQMRWNMAKEVVPNHIIREIREDLGEDIGNKKNDLLTSFLKRAKDTEEHTTDDYGWLEPNGKFHAVDWGEHQVWADKYLKEHLSEDEYLQLDVLEGEGDELVKRGWVLLHNPAQGVAFTTKDPTKPYTKAQKEFLYDYYMERNCEKEANDIWRECE